jgi:starch synthase
MDELGQNSDTLTHLYDYEGYKCVGIINGIDNKAWNPATDEYLSIHLSNGGWDKFKSSNKESLNSEFALKKNTPLIGYIGRMADQKGADLLAGAIRNSLKKKPNLCFIILGSGDRTIEEDLLNLANEYPKNVASIIAYNETLARRIYAGSDYLIMPSRFEPCGLNQMYAMRYGSVPIVTHVGGLIDTVPDISQDGNGIVIKDVVVSEIELSFNRAIKLYKNKTKFINLRNKIVALDQSWSKSAKEYANLYKSHMIN